MNWFRALLVIVTVLLPLIRPAGPQQTALADAALIALILLAWPTFWHTQRVLRFPLIGPQWLILVGSLIATLGSANTAGCIVALAQDAYIYIWFVTVCNTIEPAGLRWLGQAWVMTGLVESGLIVLGAFAGVSVLANQWGRGIGTFLNPNMAASYVVVSFFVYLATPFPRSRMLRVVGGALLLAAVVATGSNAGLAALAAGLVALAAYRLIAGRRTLWPWLGLAALAGAVLCLLLLLGAPGMALAWSGDTEGMLLLTVGRLGKGIADRASIWSEAWHAFQQTPLGLGPGTSQAGLGGELHNDFLSHLAERGVLGLAGLLWMVAATLACLWKMARADQERQGQRLSLAIGPLLAGFTAALPFMLSHEILHFRHHWLFLALIFAQEVPDPPSRRRIAAQTWAWIRRPLIG